MFGLPLFIKPRQIQLACGRASNPINLLSCESTQQLLPISHFFQPLIRSAQDIQWGSLRLHLWCYSCHGGFKNLILRQISLSLLLSLSLILLSFFQFLQLSVFHHHLTCHLPSIFLNFSSKICYSSSTLPTTSLSLAAYSVLRHVATPRQQNN